jgi:CheY-like chemotaxis protein
VEHSSLSSPRAAGRLPALIIAVTGYGQPEDRDRALQAGFDYHLTKPVDPPTLRSMILAPSAPARSETVQDVSAGRA